MTAETIVQATGRVIAIVGLMILTITLLNRWMARSIPGARAANLAAGALVFLSVSGLLTWQMPRSRRDLRRILTATVLQCIGAAAIFVCVGVLFFPDPKLVLAVSGEAVFLTALVEELVFRVTLPAAFHRHLSSGNEDARLPKSVVWLLAQVVFALCHIIPEGVALSPRVLYEFVRLTDAGLLYGVLVSWGGLWLAASVHAILNFNLLFGGQVRSSPPTSAELILGIFLAIYVLGGNWQSGQNTTASARSNPFPKQERIDVASSQG